MPPEGLENCPRRRPRTRFALVAALALAAGVAAPLATASAAGVALPGLPLPVTPPAVVPPPIKLPPIKLPPVGFRLTPTGDLVGSLAQASLADTSGYDRGLYVHYCPDRPARPRAVASHTSWAGWPAKQCLKMDKGSAGHSHVLVGLDNVHNWLLGGYGDDVIVGGNFGDVIWGDYHPSGERYQVAVIHAGNGRNVIYANDTRDYVWTGSNPATVVHAHGPGTSGVIHCQSPGIVVYMSHPSRRNFKLPGCRRISYFSVGY